jgi:hypothetical protein
VHRITALRHRQRARLPPWGDSTLTSRDPSAEGNRPSLFGSRERDPVLPAGQGDGLRMLSGLDTGTALPRPPKRGSLGGWVLAGVLGLVAAGGAYLWQTGRTAPAALVAGGDRAATAAKRLESPPVPRKVDEAPTAPSTATASQSPAAVIETVAAAAAAVTPSSSAATATAMAGAVTAGSKGAATDVADAVGARPATPSIASSGAPARAVARAPRPPAPVIDDKSAARRAPAVRAAAPAAVRPAEKDPLLALANARQAGGNGRDSDVDLIAAMVDHLQGPTKGSAASANPTPPRAAKAERPVTIARLVRDCKRLGGAEAVQCRKSICEGYWGKAQACPARLAPAKAVAVARKS